MPKIPQKNIQHAWSIFCSGISIDQQKNNLTLFNIIEQIKISKNRLIKLEKDGKKQLAVPAELTLVSLWRRIKSSTAEKANVKIKIIDPDGEERQVEEYELNFAPKIERIRQISKWAGFKVSSSGIYTLKVFLKTEDQKTFEEVGNSYLKVEILPDEHK